MNFHSSTQLTPYEVLYGFFPPIHIPYFPRDSTVTSVDDLLIRREEIIKQVKDNLRLAQHQMVQFANNKRSDKTFSIRDYVYLKLQHCKQHSVIRGTSHKLSASFLSLTW
jgi:hypothetical protein